jgi:transposase-like protein
MSYSKDVRQLVMRYVEGGGSKAEAARIYGISRGRVYVWLKLGDKLETGKKPGPKEGRKLDGLALQRAIAERPDARLKELGRQFGVHESTISYALKRLRVSHKKNVAI